MSAKIPGLFSLLMTVLLVSGSAEAQPAGKITRLGFLGAGSAFSSKVLIESFRQGLRELGYIEGQSVVIEYRYAEAKAERLPDLASELVRLRPDVIVTVGTVAALAVKQVTGTIPIVVAGAGNLVGAGLVASLARPGGNVTGSTNIDPDLSAKRLELLKESLPSLARVAVLFSGGPAGAGGDYEELKETEAAARALKVQVQPLEIKEPAEFSDRYAAMKKERARALIIFHGGFTAVHRPQLVELAMKNRLPTMCGEPTWSDAGCLISYGHDRTHQGRRAAVFVDKILKGTKPADIPVEQPTKFQLIINLKTGKQIGVTIPQSVLFRADKVIRD
jgi:putative tryptophan/tyrosine transport system substrate-binding protein